METRMEAGLLQEHSTFECMLATSCKILGGGGGGGEEFEESEVSDCPEKE